MKRILKNLFPAFRTDYYVILDHSPPTEQGIVVVMRIPGSKDCIPGFDYLRVRYFNLFGLSLFQKVEYLDLTQ